MSTSCSRRRVSCWEISNSYMEEGASLAGLPGAPSLLLA